MSLPAESPWPRVTGTAAATHPGESQAVDGVSQHVAQQRRPGGESWVVGVHMGALPMDHLEAEHAHSDPGRHVQEAVLPRDPPWQGEAPRLEMGCSHIFKTANEVTQLPYRSGTFTGSLPPTFLILSARSPGEHLHIYKDRREYVKWKLL